MRIIIKDDILLVDGKYLRRPSVLQFNEALQLAKVELAKKLTGRRARVALAFLGRGEAILLPRVQPTFIASNMHWEKIKREDLIPHFAALWDAVNALCIKDQEPRILNTTVAENQAGIHLFICSRYYD